MTPREVQLDKTPSESLARILQRLHTHGPDSQKALEEVSLYREFHRDVFRNFEQDIIAAMGLFYKIQDPSSLYTYLISKMGEANRIDSGEILTPVQASMVSAIKSHKIVSVSAPTSAGKSYSIRDFISHSTGDAAIIVPSRALIAEYVGALRTFFMHDKNVMVMPFVDAVFKSRSPRRILVLTPERARDVFNKSLNLDIRVFFFDEAQVSEDGMRGIVFDQLVRRASKEFPTAKLIFAHPFISNPSAQLKKHDLPDINAFSRSYEQGAVGKIFIQKHANEHDYYFTPFQKSGDLLKNCVEFPNSFRTFIRTERKSILAYVTKQSIYNGKFTEEFSEYIDSLPETINTRALEIIEIIRKLVGADQNQHRSRMIDLLRKGVVIHHGSVPLEVRFLLEDFIRQGHSRICFATNTLAQGINMPFDVVWLNSMTIHAESEEKRSLAFKNLIGRAGRLSSHEKFDHGYVYTKNAKLLSKRLDTNYHLSESSLIESMPVDSEDADIEIIESIRNDSFNEDLHIPESRADRLRSPAVINSLTTILNLLYAEGVELRSALIGPDKRVNRVQLESSLQLIYEAYIGRSLLPGEQAVFQNATFIIIQSFSGRTFREIVGMRYSSISRRDEKDKIYAEFSQPASPLPNTRLKSKFSLFDKSTPKNKVSYDVVMFDTYDYLDKVISFSLFDAFAAAARIHHSIKNDANSLKLIELLRFGTNEPNKVLLMRYGFLPDQIEDIIPYVSTINEDRITFKDSISNADHNIRSAIEWYT